MSSSNAPRPIVPATPMAATEQGMLPGVGSTDGLRPPAGRSRDGSRAGARQQMEHLTLLALSEDGTRLLLGDAAGVQYTLDVNNALRSAVRGEQPRPGHLENRMDSALRPRDIQSRIRSGESAEAVAAAAGTSIEKIMPYAAPVLAERAHVAERAQKSSVRRRSPESASSGARTLADAVETQMRSHNTDPNSVEWDAYRREDGRWTLTGLYETGARTGVATFIFDVPGNYVTLEDDDARWIVGDLVTPTSAAVDQDGRRLSSVPAPAALGDDAIELVNAADEQRDDSPAAPADERPRVLRSDFGFPTVTEAAPLSRNADLPPLAEDRTIDLTETVNSIRSAAQRPAAPADVTTTPTTPAPTSQTPADQTPEAVAPVPDDAADQSPTDSASETTPAQNEPAEAEAPAPKKPSKRRGRASVPSWDEIMFGGGSSD